MVKAFSKESSEEKRFEKLCEELKATAELSKKNGLYLKSVYWGGGTPTTLTAEQTAREIPTDLVQHSILLMLWLQIRDLL